MAAVQANRKSARGATGCAPRRQASSDEIQNPKSKMRAALPLLICALLPPLGLLDDALQRRRTALAITALALLAGQLLPLLTPVSWLLSPASALTAVLLGLRSARRASSS